MPFLGFCSSVISSPSFLLSLPALFFPLLTMINLINLPIKIPSLKYPLYSHAPLYHTILPGQSKMALPGFRWIHSRPPEWGRTEKSLKATSLLQHPLHKLIPSLVLRISALDSIIYPTAQTKTPGVPPDWFGLFQFKIQPVSTATGFTSKINS